MNNAIKKVREMRKMINFRCKDSLMSSYRNMKKFLS